MKFALLSTALIGTAFTQYVFPASTGSVSLPSEPKGIEVVTTHNLDVTVPNSQMLTCSLSSKAQLTEKLPLTILKKILDPVNNNYQPQLEALKAFLQEFLLRANLINLLMMVMLQPYKRLFKSLQVMIQSLAELKSHIFLMFWALLKPPLQERILLLMNSKP